MWPWNPASVFVFGNNMMGVDARGASYAESLIRANTLCDLHQLWCCGFLVRITIGRRPKTGHGGVRVGSDKRSVQLLPAMNALHPSIRPPDGGRRSRRLARPHHREKTEMLSDVDNFYIISISPAVDSREMPCSVSPNSVLGANNVLMILLMTSSYKVSL